MRTDPRGGVLGRCTVRRLSENRPTWVSVRSVYGGWVRTDPRGGVLGRCTEAG